MLQSSTPRCQAAWTRADWTELTWGLELQYQATLEKDQDLRRVIITRNNFPYLTVPQELQDIADKLFNDGTWKKTRGRQNVIHLRPLVLIETNMEESVTYVTLNPQVW